MRHTDAVPFLKNCVLTQRLEPNAFGMHYDAEKGLLKKSFRNQIAALSS